MPTSRGALLAWPGFPRHSLRLAVLLVFALGLASQSLLGAMGDVHELARHGQALQQAELADHLASHGHQSGEQGHPDGHADEEEGGALHLLLHHVHCCSHGAWMSGQGTGLAAFDLVSASLPVHAAQQVPAFRLTAPFRPPIQA